MTTPRWIVTAWPLWVTLVGLGVQWGILTVTVNRKADAQDLRAVEVRVSHTEQSALTKAEFGLFVVRDSAWKASQADLSLDTYCVVNPRANRCNP